MPSWKKVITSGSDASVRSIFVANAVTASIFSGSRYIGTSFTGSLLGTASFAATSSRAITSSFALTSSFINPTGTNVFVQGGNSFGTTALIGTNDAQSLALETNGTTRVTLDSSGNTNIATGYQFSSAGTLNWGTSAYTVGQLSWDTSGGVNNYAAVYGQGIYNLRLGTAGNASAIFVTASNGNVGIGTTSPLYKLDVNGDAATRGTNYIFQSVGNTTGYIYFDHQGTQVWKQGIFNDNTSTFSIGNAAGFSRLFNITNAGNVGIGTTSPTYKLDILGGSVGTTAGNQSLVQRLYASTSNNDYLEITNTRVSNGSTWETAGFRLQQKVDATWMAYLQFNGNNNGGLSIGTGTTTTSATTISERLRIDSSGNVFFNNWYGLSGGDMVVSTNTGGAANIIFGTGAGAGTERMRITTGGNVGIGTASPTATLTVSKAASNYIFDLENASETGFKLRTYNHGSSTAPGLTFTQGLYYNTTENASIRFYRGGSTTGGWLTFTTNDGTERVRIDNTGNVGINNTNPAYKLDVAGTIATDYSIADSAAPYRIIKPRGGYYNTQTSLVTGAIKITYPVGYTNTMHTVKARVYNYNPNDSFTITFGGYNHIGSTSWINTFAYIEGDAGVDRNFTVRFGFDGSVMAVYIGELTTGWSYPQVFIEEVGIGFSGGSATWANNSWTVGFEASAFANVTSTITNTNAHNFARSGTNAYYNIGNVGIGISSPQTQLHLSGAASIKLTNNANSTGFDIGLLGGISDPNAYVYQRANASLILGTNNTDAVRILGNGNVGIANSSPVSALHVGTTVSNTGTQTVRISRPVGSSNTVVDALHIDHAGTDFNKGAAISLGLKDTTFGSYTSRIVNYLDTTTTTGTKLQLQTQQAGGGSTFNAGILIDTTGSVGINNVSPNQKLDLIGRAKFRSDTSSSPGLWLTGNDGSENVFLGLQGTTSTDNWGVYSGGSWRLSLTNGGLFGIGTTAPGADLQIRYQNDSVTEMLRLGVLYNTANVQRGVISWHDGVGITGKIWTTYDGISKTKMHFGGLYNSAYDQGNYLTIQGDGNIGINTTTPSTTLDVNGYISASRIYPYTSAGTYIAGDGYGLQVAGAGYFYVNAANGSYFEYSSRFRGPIVNDSATYLTISGGTSGITYFNGTVGIGTTSTNAALDVAGGINSRNTRAVASAKFPIGHYSSGDTVFEIDPTWTQAQMQDYFGSTAFTWNNDSTAPGGYCIQVDGAVNVGNGAYSSGFPYVPVDTGSNDWYYMECWIRNEAGSVNNHYMGGIDYNESFGALGGNPGSFTYNVMLNYEPGTTWTKVFGYWNGYGSSAGSSGTGNTNNWVNNTKYFGPQALFNYSNSSGTRRCYISGWRLMKVNNPGNRYFTDKVAIGTNILSGSRFTISGGSLGSTSGDRVILQNFNTTTANLDSLEISNIRIGNGSDWYTAGHRIQQKVDGYWMGYIQFNGGNNGGISIGTGLNNTSPTAVTERLTILDSGNVGINNTSPTFKLDVRGAGSVINATSTLTYTDLALTNTVTTSYIQAASTSIHFFAAGGSTSDIVLTLDGSNNRAGINNTGPSYPLDVLGTIRATGDVIAYSDARVKNNIQPINNALQKVLSLRGVSYTRKDMDDKSTKIGVIAQEVLPVLPEVVSKDDNGNYSVSYGNMVGLLIEAIKEQQKEIDELKYLLKDKKNKK